MHELLAHTSNGFTELGIKQENKEPLDENFTIGDYNIRLLNSPTEFVIQMTDKKSSKSFKRKIDDTAASTLSQQLFCDKDTLHQALLDGLRHTHENITVTVNENACLTYTCDLNIGSIKREFKFSIELQEEVGDPLAKMEQQLLELSHKMLDLENVMPKLSKYRTRYQDLFLEKLGNFELKLAEIENRFEVPRYNTSSKFANLFTFSCENSSAKFQGNAPTCLFSAQACKKNGVSRFSIQVSSPEFYFGIVPSTLLEEQSCFKKANTIFCNLSTSDIEKGEENHPSKFSRKSLTTLTIATDLTSGIICFEVGGMEIFRDTLDSTLISQYEWYPCIEFLSSNSTASFLRSA